MKNSLLASLALAAAVAPCLAARNEHAKPGVPRQTDRTAGRIDISSALPGDAELPGSYALDLELQSIPHILELDKRPKPEEAREPSWWSLSPAGMFFPGKPTGQSERSAVAAELFSKWIGDTPLKAGYSDFVDGTRLHYAFREGEGPAVLVVHGRALGPEGFQRWADKMFPGRPVLFLQRPGYSGEESRVDQNEVFKLNSAHVEKAIDLARRLGQGGKVGIITHSLGAMLLPKLDPAKVAWLALLNPGVYGMIRAMTGDMQSGAHLLRAGDESTRWFTPWLRRQEIFAVSEDQFDRIKGRIRSMEDPDGGLTNVLIDLLDRRAGRSQWRDTFVQETLWVLFGKADYAPWGEHIPVFLGRNESDELVPQSVWDALETELKPGRFFEAVRRAGAHLHPLFFPQAWLRPLHEFDKAVSSRT